MGGVCNDCCNSGIYADMLQTTPISFGNTDFSGGFQSSVNGVIGNQHECYIRGKKCYANEGRFGGIVISYLYRNNDNENDDTYENNLKREYKTEYDYYLRSKKSKLQDANICNNNSIPVDFQNSMCEVMQR